MTKNRMELVCEIRKWLEEDADDMLREMLRLFVPPEARDSVVRQGNAILYVDPETGAVYDRPPLIANPWKRWLAGFAFWTAVGLFFATKSLEVKKWR